MSRLYASVIIPRPLDGTFTYRVPENLQAIIAVGMRVVVPFGPRRFITGIVESISPLQPADLSQIKDIDSILDSSPTVIHPQIKFWHWLSDYYMCAVGDIFKAGVPAGLRVESESVVDINDNADPAAIASLPPILMQVVEIVRRKPQIALTDLAKLMAVNSAEASVSQLVDAGILVMHESVKSRYTATKIELVNIAIPRGDSDALNAAFKAVNRSKSQQSALLNIIKLTGFNRIVEPLRPVAMATLLEATPGATREHIKQLAKKGLVEITTREVSIFSAIDNEAPAPLPDLSPAQSSALQQIHQSYLNYAVTLLHGVTSSGKTEIYIHLIDYILRQKRQVLFLVPEIALTTQLTRRLQRVFGQRVIIYHSRFTDRQRLNIWRSLLSSNEPCVVIGARSAIFLPFKQLGLVIVDEEHDSSYKQSDPAPRYNGRDAAIVLAMLHGAKTLLGSATPSIETYFKATEGHKYGLVSLTERYGQVALPQIDVLDLKRQRELRKIDGPLALDTIALARKTLADHRQAIFFHNRRGYSPRAHCRMCQFIPKCDFCDVALTYHRFGNFLQCHYCGAVYPVPKVCPACHEPTIEITGYGTERIEDEIASKFPDSRILRMDLDTTRSKDAYANIIDKFSEHKADILVGTQMVTKGLDFGNVGLVTVVNADTVINFPDFRSAERAFNMLEQVAGRAGRRADNPGRVIIQTYQPNHPVIQFVCNHNYEGFYNYELMQRRQFFYPPFARIIIITLKHRSAEVVAHLADEYAAQLRQHLGNRVKGPIEPAISRIASLFIRQIMLRIEPEASLQQVKAILRAQYLRFNASPDSRAKIAIHYDVDPA